VTQPGTMTDRLGPMLWEAVCRIWWDLFHDFWIDLGDALNPDHPAVRARQESDDSYFADHGEAHERFQPTGDYS
jgi:hypothetical protein